MSISQQYAPFAVSNKCSGRQLIFVKLDKQYVHGPISSMCKDLGMAHTHGQGSSLHYGQWMRCGQTIFKYLSELLRSLFFSFTQISRLKQLRKAKQQQQQQTNKETKQNKTNKQTNKLQPRTTTTNLTTHWIYSQTTS